jgi:uncharacterized protein
VIRRRLQPHLRAAVGSFPVVVLTGPRQSGKTTLARTTFPELAYASLEQPDVRQRALSDARGFLADFPRGAIIDEIQRAPELMSYLQTDVDLNRGQRQWVLTGSHNLMLLESVSQSLAGRAGLFTLLPLSYAELADANRTSDDLWDVVWRGGYPALIDPQLMASQWFASYVTTYIERDVREVLEIRDLQGFQTFLGLAATRTGSLQNAAQLGSDVGIAHNTAQQWLSVLEASFVCFRLKPFFRNLGKRLTKTPKLHFFDSGIVCYLLGIRTSKELRMHPLRGAIFETWVVSEIMKSHLEQAVLPDLSFYRDQSGLEIDLLVRNGATTTLIEVKSGQTASPDAYGVLKKVGTLIERDPLGVADLQRMLVYGGADRFTHLDTQVLPWNEAVLLNWSARG